MTLADAIRQVEALFTVHDEIGSPVNYEDQNGAATGQEYRDMKIAPCGQPYATVSSHGVNAELPGDVMVMFASQAIAIQWWVDEVKEWGRTITLETAGEALAPGSDFKALHLYWRTRPVFFSTTYLAMDQGGLMRSASPLSRVHQIDLGFVQAEMLISKLGPDGKEG